MNMLDPKPMTYLINIHSEISIFYQSHEYDNLKVKKSLTSSLTIE